MSIFKCPKCKEIRHERYKYIYEGQKICVFCRNKMKFEDPWLGKYLKNEKTT